MKITQDQLDCIIAALLAVNAYGLDKTYALLPAFREAGLTNPQRLTKMNIAQVTKRLAQAGYDRGLLTEMMAGRFINLLRAAEAGELDALPALIAKGDKLQATQLLCTVKGIGPKVAVDAWILFRT